MRVAIRELRNHTRAVIDAVERGEKVVLTRNGAPIALISPLSESATVLDWLDELESQPATDTGWLQELAQSRLDDDAADLRRDWL